MGADGGGALASLPIVALLSQGPKNKWEPPSGKFGEERSGVHRHIFSCLSKDLKGRGNYSLI